MSPTCGHVAKTILETEFQHKEIKQTKKTPANSQKNLSVFLAGTDSENKVKLNTTQKRTQKIWIKFSSLGQEPSFKDKLGLFKNFIKTRLISCILC